MRHLENIWMYFKFFFFKFIVEVLILWPVGFVLYWLAYIFRRSIDKNPTLWKWLLLWWVSNSDEQGGGDPERAHIDNWYGVYEMIDDEVDPYGNIIRDKYQIFEEDYGAIKRFFLSYAWGAFRNWTWNTKVALGRLITPNYTSAEINEHLNVLKVEGIGHPLIWRNKTIFGIQKITFRLRGTKHFRYSFTLPLDRVWLRRVLRIFNKKRNYFNLMIGTDRKRFLFKSRWFEYNSNTNNNRTMKTEVPVQHPYPVEIYRKLWKWRWRVTASNGKIIGASSQGYWNKQDMIANIKLLGLSLHKGEIFTKTKQAS
jgi:uncharacterized protein YegP (UPF0339 family)